MSKRTSDCVLLVYYHVFIIQDHVVLPVRIVLGSEVVQQKYALNPLAFCFYVDMMYERGKEIQFFKNWQIDNFIYQVNVKFISYLLVSKWRSWGKSEAEMMLALKSRGGRLCYDKCKKMSWGEHKNTVGKKKDSGEK